MKVLLILLGVLLIGQVVLVNRILINYNTKDSSLIRQTLTTRELQTRNDDLRDKNMTIETEYVHESGLIVQNIDYNGLKGIRLTT